MAKTEKKHEVTRLGSRLWQRVCLLLLALIIALTPTAAQATNGEWESLGSPGFTDIGVSNSLAMDGTTPYATFIDTDIGKLTVKRYNGSTWEAVGAPLDDQVNNSSFALNGSMPYVAIADNDGKLTVKRYNGSTWEAVGAPLDNITGYYPALVFNGATPYILFSDSNNGTKATVIRYNGTSWETIGDAGFSSSPFAGSLYPSLTFIGNTPYIVFTESDSGKLTVMKYNGSTWETVGDAGFSPHMAIYPHLAINGSTPYVTFTDAADDSYTSVVMKYNGSTWETVGNFPANTGYPTLAFVNSTPYVEFTNLTDYALSVMRYSGSSWETVGSTGVTGLPISLTSSDNWLYTMSVDAAGDRSLSVKRYNIGESGGTVSLPNAEDSKPVAITVPSATAISSSSTIKESTLTAKDNAYDYPLGLVNFRFTTAAADNTVTLQFVTDLKPYQVTARKYNPTTKEYTTITDAVITETTYSGQHALQLSYTITDNGPLDLDPATGTIDDPVGLATLSVPGAPNTGVGKSEGNAGIAVAVSVIGLILLLTTRILHIRKS